MRIGLVLLVMAGTLGANCIDLFAPCPPVVLPGVVVQVTNANTDEAVTTAIVTLTEGDYTETLVGSGDSYSGAEERPGTYTLTVTAEGYATATVTDLVVTADRCNVVTVQRDIELEPAQP